MAAVGDVRAVERLLRTLDETPRLMASVRSRALTRTDGDVRANDAAGVSANDLRGCCHADLVIAAADDDGRPRCVAVAASY